MALAPQLKEAFKRDPLLRSGSDEGFFELWRQGHDLVFTERCLPRRPKDKGLQQTRRPFHLHAFKQQRYLRGFKANRVVVRHRPTRGRGWVSFQTDTKRIVLVHCPRGCPEPPTA